MGILFRGEHAEDVVVFVDGFAVVATFLLVPPVAVRVAELPLLGGWVDVTAVLRVWSVFPGWGGGGLKGFGGAEGVESDHVRVVNVGLR